MVPGAVRRCALERRLHGGFPIVWTSWVCVRDRCSFVRACSCICRCICSCICGCAGVGVRECTDYVIAA